MLLSGLLFWMFKKGSSFHISGAWAFAVLSSKLVPVPISSSFTISTPQEKGDDGNLIVREMSFVRKGTRAVLLGPKAAGSGVGYGTKGPRTSRRFFFWAAVHCWIRGSALSNCSVQVGILSVHQLHSSAKQANQRGQAIKERESF
ncbi:hypothetical protein BVC80_1667g47 [Macleaya cordata]|uniref:Uncharacterized protein n=1 Tax=Macleaya cordata TaxID=56857 RepID=A0A200RBB6_MACCD|nr:hypothetical protein BVC80_1667g47 [Macleaya cordata]